jgi:hypothetical protein
MEEKKTVGDDVEPNVKIVGGHTAPKLEGVKIVGGGKRPGEVTTLDKRPEPKP